MMENNKIYGVFKRILCVVLAAGMVVSTSACNSNAPSQKGTDKSGNSKIEIEYWYGLGGTLGKEMDNIINDFNASQNRITVKGVKQADYTETSKLLQAAIAANQPPAAVLMPPEYTNKFMKRKALQNLDGYIEKKSDFHKDDIIPALLNYGTGSDGHIYALPAYSTTHILFYRKESFKKAGIDPDKALKSWQSLAEASKKLSVKKNGETVSYGWDPMYEPVHFIDIARAAGGQVLSKDQKTVTFDSPEWVESWESMRKWINQDHIMKFNFGGEGWEFWYKTMDDVLQGRTAGYTGSTADISDLDFNIVDAHVQPGWKDKPAKPYIDAVMSSVLAAAPEQQKAAAFEWISYLSSTEENSKFSINTGYLPVRTSCREDKQFKAYVERVPAMGVAIDQTKIAIPLFVDITGGKVSQAIKDALDLVLIENVPAKEALTREKKIAQAALDEYWAAQS
ncbi:ABC transporter substrate-binding protein [Caproiciproducens galactitolivorans]|nr:ABC transporter substrate-binding protein [Caproiciproducens galactitolivorans]